MDKIVQHNAVIRAVVYLVELGAMNWLHQGVAKAKVSNTANR